jgi:hypothetical protein
LRMQSPLGCWLHAEKTPKWWQSPHFVAVKASIAGCTWSTDAIAYLHGVCAMCCNA